MLIPATPNDPVVSRLESAQKYVLPAICSTTALLCLFAGRVAGRDRRPPSRAAMSYPIGLAFTGRSHARCSPQSHYSTNCATAPLRIAAAGTRTRYRSLVQTAVAEDRPAILR